MKAVLVFCEGNQDAVFAQRSLGARGGCEWVGRPIGELPSPFGPSRVNRKGLIATRYEQRPLEDLQIHAAAHAPPPRFESIVENTATETMFFMLRTQGKTQSEPVLDLLETLYVTFGEPPGTFEVSEYAVAFLFDANGEGVTPTLAGFRDRYGAHFGDLAKIEHGVWVDSTTVPVGCFVFHKGDGDRTGTMDDHLAPMVRRAWPDRYAKAERYIDDNRDDGDKVSNSEAERLKAIITVSGQFDHPGDPMSVIIGQNGLPRAQFDVSPICAELAGFLAQTPWNNA